MNEIDSCLHFCYPFELRNLRNFPDILLGSFQHSLEILVDSFNNFYKIVVFGEHFS